MVLAASLSKSVYRQPGHPDRGPTLVGFQQRALVRGVGPESGVGLCVVVVEGGGWGEAGARSLSGGNGYGRRLNNGLDGLRACGGKLEVVRGAHRVTLSRR